ncbi:MAG: DUF5672 family protein [Chloroflexota bacterium]
MPKRKTVAVILLTHYPELTPDQEISIRHLQRFLDRYDKFLVMPQSLEFDLPGFEVRRFPDWHFCSIKDYDQFMLSPEFYETFLEYEYILTYQPDCLVFSDQLEGWCNLGYDYIGAPLFRDKANPTKGFSRVGNGGLSLRRVESFLKVLNSPHIPSWKDVLTTSLPDLYKFPLPYRWLKKLRVFRAARRGVGWYTQQYSLNEDLFWSDRAKLFYPKFKIAPIDAALRFAFEGHPRYCYEQNNRQLPFGAHAWARWDRAFWEPFLLRI